MPIGRPRTDATMYYSHQRTAAEQRKAVRPPTAEERLASRRLAAYWRIREATGRGVTEELAKVAAGAIYRFSAKEIDGILKLAEREGWPGPPVARESKAMPTPEWIPDSDFN